MEEFETTPIAFLRQLSSICGLWPYQTPFQTFTRSIILQVCIITLYFLQNEIVKLVILIGGGSFSVKVKYESITDFLSTEFNMESSLKTIAYMLSTLVLGIVYYSGFLNKKLILRCMKEIMKNWVYIKQTKEFDILLDYFFTSKKCIIIFLLSYNIYVSFVFLLSLKPVLLDMMIPLNETRPHTLIIPMNWYNGQDKYFSKLLILQYVLLFTLGLGAICSFSAYLISLHYVCAMFQIVGCLLDNILQDKEYKLKIIYDEVVYAKILHIIHMHNKTIEFMDVLNNKFNAIYLAVMACALAYTGIAIVQLLGEYENRNGVVSLILPIFYIIFSLAWGFIFCYIGQHLQNVSEAIFRKAYGTPWYLLPRNSKRLLFFIITRAEKPSSVLIGKTFIASFEFFTALLRLSISYGMVLHSLR